MIKTIKMNRLEQLQQIKKRPPFIKSYSELNWLEINPIQKQLIELVYSFQCDGKEFTMKYETIADYLKIEYQTVKNNVGALKKLGYLITDNESNYDGIAGGSSTKLKVNDEKIFQDLANYDLADLIMLEDYFFSIASEEDILDVRKQLEQLMNPL